MTDHLTKKFTNNTLEEDLRIMLVEKNNECNALKEEIKMLKVSVAEESDAKYRAFVKISDLQRELNSTK